MTKKTLEKSDDRVMRFGLQHPNFSFDGKEAQMVDSLRTIATQAERSGFDSFWVMDHFHQIQGVGDPQQPMLEGWTTIAVVAGFTSKIKLGTLVTGNVYRHPSILAKIGATLDVLSKGRLFMGIGAAWNQEESAAYGVPFPSTKERFDRLEEAVQIIRAMWTQERTTFNGRFYQIREAYCNPKPIQKPHPPIMVGGSGERETLRIVAKYADACNIFGSPETVRRKLHILRGHCKAVGRDYDSILKTKLGHVIIDRDKTTVEKTVAEELGDMPEQRLREWATFGGPDDVRRQIEAFRDAGIDYFIGNFEAKHEVEATALFADEVVRKL
jgi:F420-dependent oxidoreductase-like protein